MLEDKLPKCKDLRKADEMIHALTEANMAMANGSMQNALKQAGKQNSCPNLPL